MKHPINVPAAVRQFLDRTRPGTTYDAGDLYSAVARTLVRSLTSSDQASARCRHEREAHDDRWAPAGCRVLYAHTKLGGLVPAEVWARAGGDPNRRTPGHYVRVHDGARNIVFWWLETKRKRAA